MTTMLRAAHAPRPADHRDDWTCFHRSPAEAMEASAASGWLWWADISEFQCQVTKDYPYSVLAIRLDTGYRLDNHAIENRAAVEKIQRIEALIGYVVFIPGQSKEILARLKKAFGSGDPGFAAMVDMESGQGFAGPGNHSSEANDFIAALADWSGVPERQLGYANAGDWATNWPTRPAGMKRILANYGPTIKPGYWAQQYKGGGNTPVPAGFPTAVKPFGSWVDLNARKTTVPELLDDLGLDWLTMATQAQVQAAAQAALVAALNSTDGQAAIQKAVAAQVAHGVDVNGLLEFDHKAKPSLEAFLTGIPGYKTIASRKTK